MAVRTYAVGDLVVPLPKAGQAAPTQLPKTLEAQLIKSITATVFPKAWKAAGGTATIEYFPLGMALVVNATPDVQAALAKYLDDVRQMNDLQIVVELKVVTMFRQARPGTPGADFLRPRTSRTRSDAGSSWPTTRIGRAPDRPPGDQHTHRPRMAILNGQEGCIRSARPNTS